MGLAPLDRRATLAALALALAYFILLAATAPSMGYTRDEGYYFKAAEQYAGWWDTLFSRRFFEAFSDAEIRLRFGFNTEHPALVKLLEGVSFRVLHGWLGLTGPAQAFRMTGFLFAALSLFATFLLGRDTVSAPVGLLAAALVAVMPRYFYDAHLATFDVPVAAMWTLCLWAFWRALQAPAARARRWAIRAGIIFGLALATKLNAMFLPPLFVLIWFHRARAWRDFAFLPGPSGGRDLLIPPLPLALISCAVLGPLVFIAHWPYLWHDTLERIGGYVGFHVHHEHYPIRYFDQVLVHPPFPWHFAWVMTLLTAPAPLVLLGALGLAAALTRVVRKGSTADLLLLASALLPIVLISMPGSPIFGGVKHWYNAMPSVAILAARGILDGTRFLAERIPFGRVARPIAIGLALFPGVLGIAASHPNGVAFYNELAGGVRGGAVIGMQRSFWGGLNRPLLPRLAQEPPGTRAFLDHTNYDAYLMYVREGTLPSGIGFANTPQEAQAATLFEDREGLYPLSEEAAWSSIGTKPSAGVYLDDVTLVQLLLRSAQSSLR